MKRTLIRIKHKVKLILLIGIIFSTMELDIHLFWLIRQDLEIREEYKEIKKFQFKFKNFSGIN